MKKFKSIYIWTCLSIITVGVLLYGYLYLIDGVFINIPMKFTTNEVSTDKLVYKKGEPIAVKWNYCKGVDTVSETSITMTDGIIYFMPKTFSNRPIGCYDNFTVVASVPDAIPSGKYRLDGIINFRVNAVKDKAYTAHSNDFYIE